MHFWGEEMVLIQLGRIAVSYPIADLAVSFSLQTRTVVRWQAIEPLEGELLTNRRSPLY